jgi:putative transposase
VRFQGLRYVAPTLAAFVGEAITIRYDPRDLSEIRVLHGDRFLCRAVSEAHAGEAVTLKDIEAARRARRSTLRAGINERIARVADLLPSRADPASRVAPVEPSRVPARRRLRIYEEDEG